VPAEQRFARRRPLGAVPLGDGRIEARVWAPAAASVEIELAGRRHPLDAEEDGFFAGEIPGRDGDDYRFVLDGRAALADPCSRSQPEGVHGPSRVVDTARFEIADGPALPLEQLVVYELHVGAFSDEGTFDGVALRLPELRELGVTAIELMPVATFPGNRGWGYDGVYTYAPHAVYGGPEGFARLVDAAHRAGLGVLLDVVYNHIGPGSEAIGAFGPYFTDRFETVWGDALDYSQRGVREWAIQNAELWMRDYKVDGLRLDAPHAVHDDSDPHVMRELADRVHPGPLVISEMGLEDFRPLEEWGHDAMWLDNLHHELHALLTGEHDGYYADFGSVDGLLRELRRLEPERLVACAQNHDQVGNRAHGDRLPRDAHRVALSVVLFATWTPLLFMGEEYDEERPFQYFTDHDDPEIAEATRRGRREEFATFSGFAQAEIPDPQDPRTFERSRVAPRPADPFYRELLALRRELPRELEASADGRRVRLRRGAVELVADFDAKAVELRR
jgi:maltooligosyltrehalose trehalohydrolase